MPNAVIKSYAERTGKSVEHVERWWDEAKEEASHKFKKKSPRYWAYVNGIVKRRAGLDEATTFRDFIQLMEQDKDELGGFCPACGEPVQNGRIKHDSMCPYAGDDVPPDEAAVVKTETE